MKAILMFEVRQVENGFVVSQGSSWQRNGAIADETYVFPTWAEASKWLGDKFRESAREVAA